MTEPDSSTNDTIAAFSTAVGGAITVIRISGPDSLRVAERVWQGRHSLRERPYRTMHLGRVTDAEGTVLDQRVLGVCMPGPASFTGEDVVEIHCHGGVLAARMVLLAVLQAGARHADPGEFTKRAFFNGKIDLTQAEAVADLIGAHSNAALRLANRQLDGLLGRRIDSLYDRLAHVLAEVEVRLDFSDEVLDWQSPGEMIEIIENISRESDSLLASRQEGEILRHGINLAIAGSPNVGKSSLMNAILGRDRAIVTDIPGTTRDTLEELAHIRGIPIRLVDTAGIRASDDVVEQTGIRRSYAAMQDAHVVLWVYDCSGNFEDQAPREPLPTGKYIFVGNKRDRVPAGRQPTPAPAGAPCVCICALNGDGLEALFDAIEAMVWASPHAGESDVAVSTRHAAWLACASRELRDARECIADEQWELAAIPLRSALQALGRITGRYADPDVLDEIFSRFCIGK